MLTKKDISRAFDGAIKGVKERKFTEVYGLSNLLVSVGGATNDNTMVLVGVGVATTGATMFQLASLSMLDAKGIENLLSNVLKDTVKALNNLKKQFLSEEEIDKEELVSALGLLANSYVKMTGKLTLLQQMAPIAPPGGAEGD